MSVFVCTRERLVRLRRDAGSWTAEPVLDGAGFYRAEAPGATPFVDVGTEVDPGTVVCLIEVMKMMNSIQAGVAGTRNGAPLDRECIEGDGRSTSPPPAVEEVVRLDPHRGMATALRRQRRPQHGRI